VPRIPFGTPVIVQPMDHGSPPGQARMRDISKSGIGLLCTTQMPLGESFLLRLPHSQCKHLWICCTVTRCHNVADGLFIVGADFDRIIEPPTASAPAGQRSIAARGPCATEQSGNPQSDAGQDEVHSEEPSSKLRDSLAAYIRQRRAQRTGAR
jgi:hypothetical protein